jgi:multidrug transporter EmrE-like cation transporter
MSWVFVATTILLTVYGQLIVKWQVNNAGDFPSSAGAQISFLLRLLLNPWIMSALAAAALAAISWMAAMTKLELSKAYPFVGASFVLVVILSAVFFAERLNGPKVIGVCLVALGIIVASRA